MLWWAASSDSEKRNDTFNGVGTVCDVILWINGRNHCGDSENYNTIVFDRTLLLVINLECKILISCLMVSQDVVSCASGDASCMHIFHSPELFSGALCFGGNNDEMPLKWWSDDGEWYSPIMLSSGLKTLLEDCSATGFLGGDSKTWLGSFCGLLEIFESTNCRDSKELCISAVRFCIGAQLR